MAQLFKRMAKDSKIADRTTSSSRLYFFEKEREFVLF